DISGVQLLLESGTPVQIESRARSTRWPLAVAAAAVAGLASIAFIHFRETAPELQAVMFSMDSPADSSFYLQYGGFAAAPHRRDFIPGGCRQTGGAAPFGPPRPSPAARPPSGTAG